MGVVAIDPSSPYSGGAILGDRIRMSEMACDPGVYHPHHGDARRARRPGARGRSTPSTFSMWPVSTTVIVETVGVGQDEVEIAQASHTTIVVSAPGLGDEIQAIKAGILEIADIHVVSKCDRSDANRTIVDLKQMLMLALAPERTPWTVPVIGTSAVSGLGFDELVDAIERHREVAFTTPDRARPPAVDRPVPAAQDRREHAAATLRRGFCERRRLACRHAHAARERPVRDGIGISAAKNPPRIPGSAP